MGYEKMGVRGTKALIFLKRGKTVRKLLLTDYIYEVSISAKIDEFEWPVSKI